MNRLKTMRIPSIHFAILSLTSAFLVSACDSGETTGRAEHHEEQRRIVVTTPVVKDVVNTQEFVCQIHSRSHIEIRALERGYLEDIRVKEGQTVKRGEVMFKIAPVLYQAALDTEKAEAEVAQIKFDNTQTLSSQSIVSKQELALAKAELTKAQAKVSRAQAELNFAALKAPFAGIVDRQYEQKGSLVEEGDILSTLSDNRVMWVYFNMSEARYLDYKSQLNDGSDGLEVQLRLSNGDIFPYPGKIGAIEADFNNETGNIAFRADFENPDGLLRHGQTGTILLHRTVPNAIVIPQRATYEILAKQYVYVVEEPKQDAPHENSEHDNSAHDHHGAKAIAEHASAQYTEPHGVVHQREIVVDEELEDLYVIKTGLKPGEKIIFEGVRQVRDGDKIAYELETSKEILSNLKYHAE